MVVQRHTRETGVQSLAIEPPLDDIISALDIGLKEALELVAQVVDPDGCIRLEVIKDVVRVLIYRTELRQLSSECVVVCCIIARDAEYLQQD